MESLTDWKPTKYTGNECSFSVSNCWSISFLSLPLRVPKFGQSFVWFKPTSHLAWQSVWAPKIAMCIPCSVRRQQELQNGQSWVCERRGDLG